MKQTLKQLRTDLEDLSKTIDIVEQKRSKFRDIDDQELKNRKLFVSQSQQLLAMVVTEFTSERAKRKIEDDRKVEWMEFFFWFFFCFGFF